MGIKEENNKYRCPNCNYPYTEHLSGRIFDSESKINSDGNLEFEVCCEGCSSSLILVVTETRTREE